MCLILTHFNEDEFTKYVTMFNVEVNRGMEDGNKVI